MKRISIHRSPVGWLCGLALLTASVCAQQLDDPFACQFISLHAGLMERVDVDQFGIGRNRPFV